ncbi:uncharacterized protein STAUR_0273 [Stigmatella aurantiaca DW4/3-1]|uniref:Uncharacterized protein n=1 Tax=Stigmatella aurantiaca (strain DW4/3-1) TaxID=378806 RepID=E3FNK3_STIAD|nr:uncharacterized protein STAUR_0273 [Stigmatella aurantiaca DW4/3-1]
MCCWDGGWETSESDRGVGQPPAKGEAWGRTGGAGGDATEGVPRASGGPSRRLAPHWEHAPTGPHLTPQPPSCHPPTSLRVPRLSVVRDGEP